MVSKAGRLFPEDCAPELLGGERIFVSRGGVKLEHALREFDIQLPGQTVLDVGASTGGFTDCLLQQGAQKVYAVDVGYGQLNWKLQTDPRVVVLDRKNIRYLDLEAIGRPVDLAVIDVSFISLKLVIPPVIRLVKPGGGLVALVKPQFEVGRTEVEHKGIIKDPQKHLTVLLGLRDFVQEQGWVVRGLAVSPITGQKGNREFFIHCVSARHGESVGEEAVRKLVLD